MRRIFVRASVAEQEAIQAGADLWSRGDDLGLSVEPRKYQPGSAFERRLQQEVDAYEGERRPGLPPISFESAEGQEIIRQLIVYGIIDCQARFPEQVQQLLSIRRLCERASGSPGIIAKLRLIVATQVDKVNAAINIWCGWNQQAGREVCLDATNRMKVCGYPWGETTDSGVVVVWARDIRAEQNKLRRAL